MGRVGAESSWGRILRRRVRNSMSSHQELLPIKTLSPTRVNSQEYSKWGLFDTPRANHWVGTRGKSQWRARGWRACRVSWHWCAPRAAGVSQLARSQVILFCRVAATPESPIVLAPGSSLCNSTWLEEGGDKYWGSNGSEISQELGVCNTSSLAAISTTGRAGMEIYFRVNGDPAGDLSFGSLPEWWPPSSSIWLGATWLLVNGKKIYSVGVQAGSMYCVHERIGDTVDLRLRILRADCGYNTNSCTASDNEWACRHTREYAFSDTSYIFTSQGPTTVQVFNISYWEVPPPAPTVFPTSSPTGPSSQPTQRPTRLPTSVPTRSPTARPTQFPSAFPTESPTELPTGLPTKRPTSRPTPSPSITPVLDPSKAEFVAVFGVGGFVFALITAVVAFLVYRRSRKQRAQQQSAVELRSIEPVEGIPGSSEVLSVAEARAMALAYTASIRDVRPSAPAGGTTA
jgi:hypothetical protein